MLGFDLELLSKVSVLTPRHQQAQVDSLDTQKHVFKLHIYVISHLCQK